MPASNGRPARAYATAAADAIRDLTEAVDAGPVEGPSGVSATLGALKTAAVRMPLALTGLGQWLARELQAGRLNTIEPSGDPRAVVAVAEEHLDQARAAAYELAAALDAAESATRGLLPGRQPR